MDIWISNLDRNFQWTKPPRTQRPKGRKTRLTYVEGAKRHMGHNGQGDKKSPVIKLS